jgi:hypothetical protein
VQGTHCICFLHPCVRPYLLVPWHKRGGPEACTGLLGHQRGATLTITLRDPNPNHNTVPDPIAVYPVYADHLPLVHRGAPGSRAGVHSQLPLGRGRLCHSEDTGNSLLVEEQGYCGTEPGGQPIQCRFPFLPHPMSSVGNTAIVPPTANATCSAMCLAAVTALVFQLAGVWMAMDYPAVQLPGRPLPWSSFKAHPDFMVHGAGCLAGREMSA